MRKFREKTRQKFCKKKRKLCEKTPNFEKNTEFLLADSSNSLHRTFNKVKEEKLLK